LRPELNFFPELAGEIKIHFLRAHLSGSGLLLELTSMFHTRFWFDSISRYSIIEGRFGCQECSIRRAGFPVLDFGFGIADLKGNVIVLVHRPSSIVLEILQILTLIHTITPLFVPERYKLLNID